MKTILEVLHDLRESDPPLEYLRPGESVALGKFTEFELVKWNGSVRFVPSEALNLPGRPGHRSFLYRGQTKHYPNCQSSLLRNAPNDEWQIKALLSLERFRVTELELVLRKHPFKLVAERHGFSVDYHGLAQHYGIPTSLLDLTSNVEVAAFFAVAHWDKASRAFVPMESGVGVIYRLDWCEFGPGYSKFFEPVGFGPGLRPARQHAWTFRLRPGVDFHNVPHVKVIEFEHTKLASESLFTRFDNGTWLYPPDCLANLVEKLSGLPLVTMEAIRHAARQDGQPHEALEAASERAARFIHEKLGLEIVDGYELQPEEDDLDDAKTQAPELDRALNAMSKGWRLVRFRPEESPE
ncbi:MAG: FRG domain-containing protein [Terracidiphilus sp.]|jgi:hypothetical protein